MLTKYEIKVVKKAPKKVEIEIIIGGGVFPSLALLTFEDMGTKGIQMVEEERSGNFVPPEIIEKAKGLAGATMLVERTGGKI